MAFFGKQQERYITLKEAATMSGYSPDYVGQLIRRGKISGKRVYLNPVWMTTEEDVMGYLRESRKKSSSQSGGVFSSWVKSAKTRLRSDMEVVRLYKGILYFTIGTSFCFSLFLFYVFSVSLDNWLDDRTRAVTPSVETPVDQSSNVPTL